MSATRQLARVLGRRVDQPTRARARLHVLDWIGVATLGATSDTGAAFVRHAAGQPDGFSAIIGGSAHCAEAAAFANGALGNIFEMDDIHRTSIMHPGDVVVPASLALAQREGCDGPALLDAVVRGYEAAIRIGTAAGKGHYALWYNSATAGVFGAAAACASLLGLDEARTVHALGLAGAQSAGTWQCRIEASDAKQLLTAHAARAGLTAADLAASGLRGAAQILEGSHGLFAATAPHADVARVSENPDGPWAIHDVSFKPWPACRHAHPVIEAALVLREDLDGQSITCGRIETYAQAVSFCDNACPQTPHEARFSLQFCTALALIRGTPWLDHFTPKAIGAADILALASRIEIVENPQMSSRFPTAYPASLSLDLGDGRRIEHSVMTALGDPENPLSQTAITDKAHDLITAAGCHVETADLIVARCLALETAGDLRDLLSQSDTKPS